MANFDTIKTVIDANINTNGTQNITGGKMNSILKQMVDATDAELTELSAETNTKLTELSAESSHLTLEGAKETLVEKKYYNFIVGETYNVILRNAISADTIQVGEGYTIFGIAAYSTGGKISDLVNITHSMIPTMDTSYSFTIPSGTEYLKVVGRCDIGTTIDMLFAIVPKDVVESIKVVSSQLNETKSQLLSFQVEGNDTTLVFSDIKRNIVPGHRYRVYIKNPDIDMSGLSFAGLSYVRFSILSYDSSNNRTALIFDIPWSLPLLPYYDVTLPDTSKGLGIAIRAKKGEILEVYAEDTTISLTNKERLAYEETGIVAKGNLNYGFYNKTLEAISYSTTVWTYLVPVKAGKLYHVKGKQVRDNMRLYDSAGNEIQKDSNAYFGTTVGENLKMPLEYGEGLRLQIPVSTSYGDKPEDIQLYEDIALPQMPIEGDFSLDMESVEYDGKVGTELKATKFAEIYSRYDTLVSAYPNNMSKKLLGYGTATDGNDDTTLPIYEYTFNPLVGHGKNQTIYEGEIPFPNYTKKIILTSGVHGREKISVEAVYKFMENVCKGENSQFASLASNFVIKVIPLVNPFSYDDFSRLNKRGVNINRNLGYSWDNQDIHDATDKGSAAYSEKESQILRDWLRENSDAILFIDAHDSMYSSQYANVAAYVCSADDDILKLGASHIKVESRKVWNDNPSLAKKIYGFIASQKGAVTYWEGASVGIKASSIIEINDYFFNNEQFNQYAIELHCWAVYNWILANIQYVLKK